MLKWILCWRNHAILIEPEDVIYLDTIKRCSLLPVIILLFWQFIEDIFKSWYQFLVISFQQIPKFHKENFNVYFLMINEFFLCFAIKFVWRRNLCDKTLAVIPKKFFLFGSYCWMWRRRAATSWLWVFLLSFHKMAHSLHFVLPPVLLFKFVVTNKFNYKK